MVAADLLNEDVLSLGMRADQARRARAASNRVLYQRVHVVGLRDVHDRLTVPEPASEVRVIGTPDTLEDALTMVRAVKEAAGPRPVSAFSAADVIEHARAGWGDVRTVLAQLADAGLTDFAELPADLVDDLAGVVRTARAAGLRAVRVTMANAAGDRKGEILDRIRRCATDPGSLERVNPLPRHTPADKPTTGYEDVRMVALARLVLADVVSTPPAFVEVDWSLYGPKLAQVALTFGADFLDAVAATTDDSLGRRRGTVEDVERNIRAAGFEPEEYRPLSGQGSAPERRGA